MKVTAPTKARAPVWDLATRTKIGEAVPGQAFEVRLKDVGAHLFYVGSKYAAAIPK